MPVTERVYIVGFMGSGKSTAGKKLATLMNWSFIDLDKQIEEAAGKTIPEIFETEGEEHFRDLESKVLASTTSVKNPIISTGGGTPCHGNNMDFMLASGLTVYLKLTPEQLTSRLLGSSGERPLIKNIPDDQLNEFIAKKLSEREPWYSKAGVTASGFNLNISILQNVLETMIKGEDLSPAR